MAKPFSIYILAKTEGPGQSKILVEFPEFLVEPEA
jgi:hypothetical protein